MIRIVLFLDTSTRAYCLLTCYSWVTLQMSVTPVKMSSVIRVGGAWNSIIMLQPPWIIINIHLQEPQPMCRSSLMRAWIYTALEKVGVGHWNAPWCFHLISFQSIHPCCPFERTTTPLAFSIPTGCCAAKSSSQMAVPLRLQVIRED